MTELRTNAEKCADKARTLPAFKNFSLPGVKDKIAEMLNMIGRVEGIFSTYTIHDINHVDAMLQQLDWLIPPSTKEKMTPLDWLMTVLAIYLHDLGMIVSTAEFQKREKNIAFCDFISNNTKDLDGKEFLARIENMKPDEKERFLFQEFIRNGHTTRIKEWITGNHSATWGNKVKPIAREIADLLSVLPGRFRTNLGDVCESHHLDNLDNKDLFPLCQGYGNNPDERVNVQYCALLLRTTDLLHITQDRTPSIMYKTLRISDPKGIIEWKKQSGTFYVRMKNPEFDPSNTTSHIIKIGADFSEERPFFALTEYLVYADGQIKQTKRWADISIKDPQGNIYWFPWQGIESDIRVEGNEPRTISFELDRGRLLDLLVGHTLYNDPTVAVRELI
ncbi:MAG: hypothetical protein HZB92_05670 [Euryarchaeota archaeon]|nr:hypothetical protein [Euryarchaeota archaeon]